VLKSFLVGKRSVNARWTVVTIALVITVVGCGRQSGIGVFTKRFICVAPAPVDSGRELVSAEHGSRRGG